MGGERQWVAHPMGRDPYRRIVIATKSCHHPVLVSVCATVEGGRPILTVNIPNSLAESAVSLFLLRGVRSLTQPSVHPLQPGVRGVCSWRIFIRDVWLCIL